MIAIEKWGTLIVEKGFKKLPKSNKSPNLVTLLAFTPSLRVSFSHSVWASQPAIERAGLYVA